METRGISVRLKNIHHRGQDVVALFFPYNTALIAEVKKLPEVKYSKTHTCWYLPSKPDTVSLILGHLKGKAWVDYSLLAKAKKENAIPGGSARQATKKPMPQRSEGQSQALRMMEQKLKLRGYSPNTVRTYLMNFGKFLHFFDNHHPIDLTETDIRNYLLFLIERHKVSRSAQNQAINAIKFFYEKVMMQERKVYHLERPIKEKKLPEILSQQEIVTIFSSTGNIKHQAMLMLIYSAGLRRSELLNLRIGDVDFDRRTVLIRGSKGHKDRYSILADQMIPLLNRYLLEFNPGFWLFEGRAGQRYTASSLQQVFKQAVKKAGIKKVARLHMLRHSFATHLLESGTSTRYIQVLLGHESSKTTEIYAQVTSFALEKIKSPLDQIAVDKRLKDGREK